jgi:alkylation response protein AidB-like acyl-CoA dehydrogenase
VWIPKEYGGRAGSVLDLCLVVEQFAQRVRRDGRGLRVNALGSFPILLGGTEEQKRRWLPGIARRQADLVRSLPKKTRLRRRLR